MSPAAHPPRPWRRDGEAKLLAARCAASAALVMALCFSLAAGADGPQAAAQQPAREQRREEIREEQKPGTVGKVIIQWDHLVDSNDKTFEDFWACVAYKQAHVQLWSGEFTDGAEIGGYLKDHRRSAYAGLYRFRDDFDHVLQFDTEQVLKKGWVLAAMLRGIRSGWLDKRDYQPLVDKAWYAVRTRAAPDGSLVDVCTGTGKQKTLRDYFDRPAILGPDPRGGAMALLFATEMLAAR
jgi:hypothetical protein